MKKTSYLIKNIQSTTVHPPLPAFGEILNKLMEKVGIDATQLHKNTGIPVSTINRLRNDPDSNPTLTSLIPLASFFGITVSQLIGDEVLPIDYDPSYQPHPSAWMMVPVLNREQTLDWPQNRAEFQTSTIRKIATDADISADAFAIIMQDDSMAPRFPPGTFIILDPYQPINHRDFVLILIKDYELPIFKQILIDEEFYYLKSLHKDFKEIRKIKRQEPHKIIGVMVQARMNVKN